MAKPRKKKKPAPRKAKPTSTAAARKAGGKKAASKVASAKAGSSKAASAKAGGSKTAARGSAAGRTAGTTGRAGATGARKRGGTRTGGSATAAREKLIAVRPSGGKDDSFFELVHEVARQIPRGRVTSYGAIGAALGTRSSARMVGWAMNACHLSTKPVPAHRVVNSVGLLTGRHHFKPPEKMQLLLEEEGIVVENNKVVDFQKLFWDPSKEL
jgi:methylated-DNA-protein-cysteine methyltransferase-like protein